MCNMELVSTSESKTSYRLTLRAYKLSVTQRRQNAKGVCLTAAQALHLNRRPPIAAPLEHIDTQALVAVSVPDRGVDVVVVDDGAFAGVVVDALTTGAVDLAVRAEDERAAVRRARGALLVNLELLVSKRFRCGSRERGGHTKGPL